MEEGEDSELSMASVRRDDKKRSTAPLVDDGQYAFVKETTEASLWSSYAVQTLCGSRNDPDERLEKMKWALKSGEGKVSIS